MSDTLIASLQKRIDDQGAEIVSLNGELGKRRHKDKERAALLESITKERDGLLKERDELKVKAEATPKEQLAEIERLKGELLGRDHRDAFGSVKEFTVKGEDGKEAAYTLRSGVTVESLWKNTDYKPEGDKPDEATIHGFLGKALTSCPYLFEPKAEKSADLDPGGSPRSQQGLRREPGPGSGSRVIDPSAPRPSVASQIQADYASSGRKIPGRL